MVDAFQRLDNAIDHELVPEVMHREDDGRAQQEHDSNLMLFLLLSGDFFLFFSDVLKNSGNVGRILRRLSRSQQGLELSLTEFGVSIVEQVLGSLDIDSPVLSEDELSVVLDWHR